MVIVLTGGTGGAKLLQGLNLVVDPKDLTVICNTADDFVSHGLYIAPDLDTITYAFAGLLDAGKGWGIENDSFVALEALGRLGAETWFRLGDRDLATHITRTRLMREGLSLSQATKRICEALGIEVNILPMCDEHVETVVATAQGDLSFQEYFVKRRWADDVQGVGFAGFERAQPAPGVLDAIAGASAIIVCPSNPVTSIGPILAVPKIREALKQTAAAVVAVSPIIDGVSVTGPAHRLMAAMNLEASALGVASAYADFIDMIIIAEEDKALLPRIETLGVHAVTGGIRMGSLAEKSELATTVINLCREIKSH
jgi:LPPG:FO 2-phospho-L-lactate transferase